MRKGRRAGKMEGLGLIGLGSMKGNRLLKKLLRILLRKALRVGSNLAQPRSRSH